MAGEKTEKPTAKKLEQSAEKGQTANRKFAVEAVVLVTGVVLVYSFASSFWVGFNTLFSNVYNEQALPFDEVLAQIADPLMYLVQQVMTVVLSLGIISMLAQLMMNKFNFAPGAMSPKFEKFNPVQTLKGILSVATLYNFFRMMIIFTGITLFFIVTLISNFEMVLAAAYCGVSCLVDVFPGIILLFITLILSLFCAMAAGDFKLQNLLHQKNNKMTKDDVKQERKGQDGDPVQKGARRRIAREDAIMPRPQDATHLIVGSGVAVAVIFHEDNGLPPFIVAKYKTENIGRIVGLYSAWGVPVARLDDVARQFHQSYAMYTEADARAAKGMLQAVQATGTGA